MADDDKKKPRRRVKKVKGHGGHHGGAWKVAYADFVTAMMALFLVLWLVSQADTKLKQEIANYFRSPGVFDQQAGGVIGGPKKISKDPSSLTSKEEEQMLFGIATILKRKFDTRPEFQKFKDQIKIEVTEQGLKIQIVDKAERVSFASGSAALNPGAKAILDEIARAICELPNPILIGGHTDRSLFPSGSDYTNWELSTDRANAARRELQANCVKPEQIRRIVGYADTELLLPNDPYSDSNRRISITVLRLNSPDESAKSSQQTEKELAGTEAVELPQDNTKHVQVGAVAEPKQESEKKPGAFKKPGSDKKSVSVGTPDEVPANVKLSKEPKPAAKH